MQDLPGWQVQVGQGVRGGAQLDHDRGGLGAVAHRVADDQGRPAVGQRDDVVPVAAHHAVADRQVAVRDLQARRDLRPRREQAPLQRAGGPPFPLIQPGVIQAHRRAGG